MVLFQLSVLLMLASTHSQPHKRQADDMDHGDMNYTPTNRPRPTGEMTEGPDGETDGMTDDGMTEDPNGVTGGSTCKCGLEGERRIVGGEDSTRGKYPSIV